MLKCMHCQTRGRCPIRCVSPSHSAEYSGTQRGGDADAYLEGHQQTLAFNVGKAQVYAARVTVGITIPDYVFHALVYLGDEAIRQSFDVRMVSLHR